MGTAVGLLKEEPGSGEPRSSWTRFRNKPNDAMIGYLLVAPFFIFYGLFVIWPVFRGFYISFHEWDLVGQATHWVGLRNYNIMVSDRYFWSSMRNTVYFVILSGPVLVALGLLLAVLINRPYRNMGVFRTLFYLPSVLSIAVITTIWIRVYNSQYGIFANWARSLGAEPLRWLTTVELAMPAISLTTIWWTVGGNMVIFLAGLQDIPADLYEAAALDGANRWQSFWNVTVPGMRRTIGLVTILQVISSFNIFGQVYSMTNGGPGGSTRTIIMYIYERAFKFWQLGYASAMAYGLAIIMFTLSILQLKAFGRSTTGEGS